VPPALRSRDYAEETARRIDETAREIVDRAYDRAVSVIEENRTALDRLAERLLEVETLGESELREGFAVPERGRSEARAS
jgi:cell division protease FtsH